MPHGNSGFLLTEEIAANEIISVAMTTDSTTPASLAAASTSVFDSGGGVMGARLRAFGWAGTPLGAIGGWTGALRVAVDLMMSSHFPSCLFWGPDLVAIYNNGYLPILGKKPAAQ